MNVKLTAYDSSKCDNVAALTPSQICAGEYLFLFDFFVNIKTLQTLLYFDIIKEILLVDKIHAAVFIRNHYS